MRADELQAHVSPEGGAAGHHRSLVCGARVWAEQWCQDIPSAAVDRRSVWHRSRWIEAGGIYSARRFRKGPPGPVRGRVHKLDMSVNGACMLVLVHLAHVGAALSHRDAHLRRRALRRPSEDARDGYRGPREPQTGSSTGAWNGSSPSNVCPASLPARRSRILGGPFRALRSRWRAPGEENRGQVIARGARGGASIACGGGWGPRAGTNRTRRGKVPGRGFLREGRIGSEQAACALCSAVFIGPDGRHAIVRWSILPFLL